MKRLIALSLGLLVMMGCGTKRESLSGKVTYKGQTVNNVSLHFYPIDGKSPDISIPVLDDGTFRATGIKPGEYKVVVTPPPQMDDMAAKMKGMKGPKADEAKRLLEQNKAETKTTIPFPKKYQNIIESDLKCTIGGGQETVNLEMKD